MRFESIALSAVIPVGKWLFIFFNLIVFMLTLCVIEMNIPEKAEIHETRAVFREIMLPHLTLTDEIKVEMFLKSLTIDPSIIKPKKIAESVAPWEAYIERYATHYGVDSDLIRAIIYAESKGDPYSISRDGAIGLMQIMPSTADYLGFSNMLDPEENIRAGVKYIALLDDRYKEPYVLWAWNAGPRKLQENFMPVETKRFIVEVLTIKSFLKDEKSKTI